MRVNRWGCAPTEDVCMAHHRPLICRHGCQDVGRHLCGGYASIKSAKEHGCVRMEPNAFFEEQSREDSEAP